MRHSSRAPRRGYRKRFARRTDWPLVLITRPFDGRRRLDVFLAVQVAAGADFLGGVTVGGLTIGPDGADALKRGTEPADSCRDALMDLNALLRRAVELGASDIHLKLDQPPMLRLDGAIVPLDECPPLNDQNLLAGVEAVTRLTPERLKQFHETGDLDIAYTADGLPRFRVNVFRQRGAISIAMRVIPRDVPSFEQLSLPPGVARLANEHRGLILVTGATGSGKTTTLAAMLDHINHTRHQHIVTIEDPIEILHVDRQCIINQREVGLDTASFEQGLRRVLRQDPDVILIGELRDAETAQTALQAAESGHLVFSTLHTIDAAETVGRMIEFFPPAKQEQIRSVLAGVLRGVVSQRLLPRQGGGRIAAVEVMVMNARISDLIREERAEEIADAVAEGGFFEMQTFQQALIEHVLSGLVEREIAANAASNAHDFGVALDQALKWQKATAMKEQSAAEAAVTDTEVPALRVVRPAEG